jgi:hypothetical protein
LVLNALFSWLVDQHYLQTNPMKGMPKLSRTSQQLDINRSFSKKYREVPVPTALIQIIDETYLMLTGEAWRTVPKTFPLIPRIRGQSVSLLKPLAIHKVLKAFFSEIADSLAEASEKLTKASTYWLRHKAGRHEYSLNRGQG